MTQPMSAPSVSGMPGLEPAVQFCCVEGCFDVAVGAARSREHCRAHYVSEILDKVGLVRCEVTMDPAPNGGEVGVTDARTQETVPPGGIVELDPAETRIAALAYSGAVKVLPDQKAAAELKKSKG